MTADEALKKMRHESEGCLDCQDPEEPFTKAIGTLLVEWADAIEAELRRLREENTRLRELADEKPSGMSWKEATS